MKNTNLFDQMMASQMPATAKQNGKYSFRIIRSECNGKRITVSKTLKSALGLSESFMLTANEKERKIFIGKSLPAQNCVECKFSQHASDTCYKSSVADTLVDMFNLDYNGRVSRTFTDIEIVDHNGITFAVINIPEADANTGDSEVNDESALESA